MPRADLLSLSPDDLATLANRGLVKRAQAELDGGQVESTPTENAAGTVSVLWSDDVHCLLPASKPLQEATCSCAATGICRHLVRSVLAYQRQHAATAAATAAAESAIAAESAAPTEMAPAWNPGALSDEDLARVVSPATLKRARALWDEGQLIEVALSARPTARFHSLGAHTRFLVPDDARYTHCDCAQAHCVHVALAVWAFRRLASGLAPDAASGLVSTRTQSPLIPVALLDAIENAMGELAEIGVAGAEGVFPDKLTRLERELRAGELIWPADVVADLRQQLEWHRAHNARFEAARVAQLVGELLSRADAIRRPLGAVPDVWVRGTASDRAGEIGAARLIGIGTGARFYRGGVELRAWMQDSDSGAVVCVAGDFPDPVADASRPLLRGPAATPMPQPLSRLGAQPKIKGVSLGAIGAGQLLARGGKRAPSGALSFGRTAISLGAQTFAWEKLRAPLLAENFAEVAAHLSHQAPAMLRPRREGENLFVVPLAGVEDARFASATQDVRATLRDPNGEAATLVFPFTARGSGGVEALLQTLHTCGNDIRFVSGRAALNGAALNSAELTIKPLALIVQAGETRRMVAPWVSEAPTNSQGVAQAPTDAPTAPSREDDALGGFGVELNQLLGETFLLGLSRADELLARSWRDLEQRGASLGFSRLIEPVAIIAGELETKSRVRAWKSPIARAALLRLSVLAPLL